MEGLRRFRGVVLLTLLVIAVLALAACGVPAARRPMRRPLKRPLPKRLPPTPLMKAAKRSSTSSTGRPRRSHIHISLAGQRIWM